MARYRKRSVRPSARPEQVSAFVDEVLRSLKVDETARGFRALRAFQRAAGPRLLQRARAERLRGSTLMVRVTSSAWAQELHTIKPALLEKLHATEGGHVVEDLRFSVGPLDELPDWTPYEKDAPAAPPSEAQAELAPEVLAALESVRDPELREALSLTLSRSPRR
jgi:hypothetical protein